MSYIHHCYSQKFPDYSTCVPVCLSKSTVAIICMYVYQACMQGGSRGFDRTPYFCSLKLIASKHYNIDLFTVHHAIY